MNIKLSEHFTYKKLLRFALPSMAMMVFTSIYGVVDGFFVSNYAGKTPFAAVNFIMPLLMMLSSVGFMLGTGGSALVAKTMGEDEKEKARKYFSLFVYVTLVAGVIISALGIIFIRPIASFLGAQGELLDNAVFYGRIILLSLPFFMLQLEFQSFFVTAEKPQLGLAVTIIAGCTNMILDFLLVGVFSFGLGGAAVATAVSETIGGVFPLIYFSRPNTSTLKLCKTKFYGKALLKACTNGSSELMSNISMSLVSMLYNLQLLKFAGENGVAAYGVMMYVGFIFNGAFIGYSIGTAPVISYHFGAANHKELKNLRSKSTKILGIFSTLMLITAQALAPVLAGIFVSYDQQLFELTVNGFRFFAFSFLFSGFAIFSSGFFTALNDGLTSALISFSRTLLFQISSILILPLILGINGIWLSVIVAEFMAVVTAVFFLLTKQKKYHY